MVGSKFMEEVVVWYLTVRRRKIAVKRIVRRMRRSSGNMLLEGAVKRDFGRVDTVYSTVVGVGLRMRRVAPFLPANIERGGGNAP